MEIKRVVWSGSCGVNLGCLDADTVTILDPGLGDSWIAICDDCLEKVVKAAGWDVEKEGVGPPTLEWRGEPGHFCGAHDCMFHMHTHVNGKWCVSTVGEWYPTSPRERTPEKIGSDRLYESMVFRVVGDGIDLAELEMAPYNDREAAQKGHMTLVEKYKSIE